MPHIRGKTFAEFIKDVDLLKQEYLQIFTQLADVNKCIT